MFIQMKVCLIDFQILTSLGALLKYLLTVFTLFFFLIKTEIFKIPKALMCALVVTLADS